MIRLGGIVTLKPLKEAEEDKYVSIGFGKYKEKGKEKDPNAPTFKKDDGGKFVPTKSTTGKGSEPKKTAPKVNIFDKPAVEPKKDEPTQSSEPKKIRQGNPQVNKATKAKAENLGITPQKLGKDEYQKKMAQAAYEALTDSNYHSEARELIAKLEGKPELAEKPQYPSMDDPKFREKMDAIKTKYASEYSDDVEDDARDLGISASQESGWSGDDAVAGIAFTLRMNGFHKLADTIQSVIKESKSTSLTSMLSEISYDPKAKRFLDTIQVVDSSIKDLKNITVDATPRGNWTVYHKGKVLTTINGKLLDDSTIMKYGMEHYG
jgi:hypothetical protein